MISNGMHAIDKFDAEEKKTRRINMHYTESVMRNWEITAIKVVDTCRNIVILKLWASVFCIELEQQRTKEEKSNDRV